MRKIYLREIRHIKGISAPKLAETSGVSKTHIYEIEYGHRKPTFDVLDKLANALGVQTCILYKNNCSRSKRSRELMLGKSKE